METEDEYRLDDDFLDAPQPSLPASNPPPPAGTIILPAPRLEDQIRYTPEIGNYICNEIASTTKSARTICEELRLPYNTWKEWIKKDPLLQKMYANAKELQMDEMGDEMLRIADSEVEPGDMAAASMKKLAVETRKFLMGKLAPKKYGNNSDVNLNINTNTPMTKEQFQQFLEQKRQERLDELKQLNPDGGYTEYEELK